MSNYKPIQNAGNLDWLSFADDIHAPHPDLFEFELDNTLAGVDQAQLQLLSGVDFNADPYQLFRSDTITCGPPSTFTVSSESTYETHSAHSDSVYSFPRSPTTYTESVYSSDLQMSFANFNVDGTESAVAAPQPIVASDPFRMLDDSDPDSNSFGELPLTSYGSNAPASFDYDSSPVVNHIQPADFYLPAQHVVAPIATPQPLDNTSSHASISLTLPIPRVSVNMSEDGSTEHTVGDGRRKYQCLNCPRAFARAYNLKTHMATHDPHRPKPFTCPHKACGRSFSRKHDLGRHLVSIHHDDPEKKRIGVENGARTWCDSCGRGVVGSAADCTCAT